MDRVQTQLKPTGNVQDDDTVLHGLTSENVRTARAVQYLYLGDMQLLRRDAAILDAVAEFGSLTTAQIHALFFHELKSQTPCTRALRRLVDNGSLARVGIRLATHSTGGSPMGCYQIGPDSWKSYYKTRFRPLRDQKKIMHTIEVATTFIAAKHAERAGDLRILKYGIEYDAWIEVAGQELHPDLYMDIGLPKLEKRVVQWIEVDRSGEREKQLDTKIRAYIHAYQHRADYPLPVFPSVLWLAIDEKGAQFLRQVLSKYRDIPEDLFQVATIDAYPQILQR